MNTLKPQDDEASDEAILEALARVAGRDDAHARLIRALAGRVYVEHHDRMHWMSKTDEARALLDRLVAFRGALPSENTDWDSIYRRARAFLDANRGTK